MYKCYLVSTVGNIVDKTSIVLINIVNIRENLRELERDQTPDI